MAAPKNKKPPVRYGANASIYNQGGSVAQAAYQNTPAWKLREAAQKAKQSQAALNPPKEKDNPFAPQSTGTNPFQMAGTPSPELTPNPQFSGIPSSFYQVKKEDKSLADVAKMNNVPLWYMSQLNNTKSLPPKGSYLQLREKGVPDVIANQVAGLGAVGSFGVPKKTVRRGGDDLSGFYQQINTVATQLQSGQLPANIPISMLPQIKDANGQPTTLQDWLAEGYTVKNGVLVKGGTGGVGGPGGATTPTYSDPRNDPRNTKAYQYYAEKDTPFTQQMRWDPTVRKFVPIGKLLKQGKLKIDKPGTWFYRHGNKQYQRKRGGGGGWRNYQSAAPAAPVQSNIMEGPTILDIHLGSG